MYRGSDNVLPGSPGCFPALRLGFALSVPITSRNVARELSNLQLGEPEPGALPASHGRAHPMPPVYLAQLFCLGVTEDSFYQTANSQRLEEKQWRRWVSQRASVALYIASHRGHAEAVQYLLEHGNSDGQLRTCRRRGSFAGGEDRVAGLPGPSSLIGHQSRPRWATHAGVRCPRTVPAGALSPPLASSLTKCLSAVGRRNFQDTKAQHGRKGFLASTSSRAHGWGRSPAAHVIWASTTVRGASLRRASFSWWLAGRPVSFLQASDLLPSGDSYPKPSFHLSSTKGQVSAPPPSPIPPSQKPWPARMVSDFKGFA